MNYRGKVTDPRSYQSIILEKDEEITQDPRGAVLTGVAVRCLWKLGLGGVMHLFGHGRCA